MSCWMSGLEHAMIWAHLRKTFLMICVVDNLTNSESKHSAHETTLDDVI